MSGPSHATAGRPFGLIRDFSADLQEQDTSKFADPAGISAAAEDFVQDGWKSSASSWLG
jgi:hypothetical protein